jgi:hypothetical protein
LALSFILGSIFYFAGIGKTTHEFFNDRVPLYNYATYDSMDAWNRPAIGRLAGIIVSIKDKNDFFIMDFSGHIWHVELATSTRGLYVPEASSTIRMFGVLEASSSLFIAESVYEWEE